MKQLPLRLGKPEIIESVLNSCKNALGRSELLLSDLQSVSLDTFELKKSLLLPIMQLYPQKITHTALNEISSMSQVVDLLAKEEPAPIQRGNPKMEFFGNVEQLPSNLNLRSLRRRVRVAMKPAYMKTPKMHITPSKPSKERQFQND